MRTGNPAIETLYKDHHFRSRLEARWAIFFDEMGVGWEYEKQGYEMAGGVRYLPDFVISKGIEGIGFVEIKPNGDATEKEKMKCYLLAKSKKENVLLLSGKPGDPIRDETYHATVFIGNFDTLPVEIQTDRFFDFRWQEFYSFLVARFNEKLIPEMPPVWTGNQKQADKYLELDKIYFKKTYGKDHPEWRFGLTTDQITLYGLGFIQKEELLSLTSLYSSVFTEEMKNASDKAVHEKFGFGMFPDQWTKI
jgi:hypothetical protein